MPEKNGVIAVLTDEYIDYRKILVDRIASAAKDNGFGVVCFAGGRLPCRLNPTADASSRIFDLAVDGPFDGVICLSGTVIGKNEDIPALTDQLNRFDIPVISLGIDLPDISSVTVNDVGGMHDLMQHLLTDTPRREFAFIQGLVNDNYSLERERVFRQVLDEHGCPVKSSRIICGNYDTVDSYRVAYDLLKRDRSVDAIVAANDMMALSAAKAANALGIAVPQELLITGFDDTPDATRNAPAITTVRQPLLRMADNCVSMLLEHIVNRRQGVNYSSEHRQVSSELIIRGSTLASECNAGKDILTDENTIEARLRSLMSGLSSPGSFSMCTLAQSLWETLHGDEQSLTGFIRTCLEETISPDHIHWWTNLCHQIETLAKAHLAAQHKSDVLAVIIAAISPMRERIWSMNMDHEFEIRRLQSVQSAIQLELSASTEIEQILASMSAWLGTIEAERCYLVRFEEPSTEVHRFATVIHSCKDATVDTDQEQYFRTHLLLPASNAGALRQGLLILNPVYAGADLFGYLLLDPKGLNRLQLNAAANSIGNAMRNRYLIGELEKQTLNLKSVNQSLVKLANFDALTGLPNRLSFQRYLRENCDTTLHENRSLCLLFIDLDGFKSVNDSLGHAAGDLLLKTVGSRLKSVAAARTECECFIARLGGDEFTMVLGFELSEEVVNRVTAELLECVARPYGLGDEVANISASIGYAFFPRHGNSARELLKSADTAMYRAKELGKNRAAVYSSEFKDENSLFSNSAQILRQALDNQQLQLYFQPRVDLSSGNICAVEALIRWVERTPAGLRFVASPDEVMKVAEKSGLISMLDEFALDAACRQSREWEISGTALVVSVNVSASMLQQDSFIDTLLSVIDKYGVDPSLLELEISENVATQNTERYIVTLEGIQKAGIRVSFDDFGSGYFSLNYLHKLPVSNLIIDHRLVSEICAVNDESGEDARVVRSVAALGHSMGLGLIAEGVVTEEQLAFVKSIGCHQGQGSFFGDPVLAEVVASNWLSTPNKNAA